MEFDIELNSINAGKAAKLLSKAADLGMDMSGYGFIEENPDSGCVYIWCTDYKFDLCISLGSSSVHAIWIDPYDGEEVERIAGNSLDAIYKWCDKLEKKSERKQKKEENKCK